MKLKGKYGIGNLLKIILEIGFCIGCLLLCTFIPILNVFNISINWFLAMVYPSGICFLGLVCQFIEMFDSLKNNNPFCQNTVIRLKRAMYLSYIISFFVAVALIIILFFYNYYTLGLKICIMFICILFFGVGTALYMLKELFIQAINYKEENDLTI